MTAPKKFTTGQPVIVTTSNNTKGREATVTSVGRTIVHVSSPGDAKGYRVDTGALNDKLYPMYGHIYTVEEWELRERRAAVHRRLHNLGVSGPVLRNRSVEALEQVVAVLEADGAVAVS
ncbi:hypothetical protein [Curtobacterium sp. MCSS17_016]|uniref:beta barrel domain-containing protein n=1 Tax=Curtobacterium sp. MCSS17_016 TaxID=2175644 RepID=UPI000DA8D18C|nr:hypothetical protein [Curtobacterium sp. MCSS17_016]WIE81244.1 hypothetical protein DEJ19_018595 [Curtobacterium sp. MCSS17_016]